MRGPQAHRHKKRDNFAWCFFFFFVTLYPAGGGRGRLEREEMGENGKGGTEEKKMAQ